MSDVRIERVGGQVPHTVIALPSGRTLAYGDNPDKTNGGSVTALVKAGLEVVLSIERAAQLNGGAVSSQARTEALDQITAVQSSLDAVTGAAEAVTWGRVPLDRMYRLVSTMPTR